MGIVHLADDLHKMLNVIFMEKQNIYEWHLAL